MNYDIPFEKKEKKHPGEDMSKCDMCGFYVPDRLLTYVNVDDIKYVCNECLENLE